MDLYLIFVTSFMPLGKTLFTLWLSFSISEMEIIEVPTSQDSGEDQVCKYRENTTVSGTYMFTATTFIIINTLRSI